MLMADEYAAPVARIFTSNDIPPGLWTRNEHWFTPITPLCADFQVGSEVSRGFNGAMDELALPTPRFDFIVIDGYGYQAMLEPMAVPSAELLSVFEQRVCTHHESALIREWRDSRRADAEAELDRARQLDLAALSDGQLLSHIRQLSEYTVALCRIHFANILATAIIVGRFGIFCNEHLQLPDADVFRLLTGGSEASRRPALELERIARIVNNSPELQAALRGPEPWADPEIQHLLLPYLQAYGDQALDFEFSTATLAEQPERVVRLLQDAVDRTQRASASPTDPHEHALHQDLRNRLSVDAHRLEFDRLREEAVQAYGVRDDDCTFVMLAWGLMRRRLLEAGGRLARRGLLGTSEDVWYLRRAELEQALSGIVADRSKLRENIQLRHAERKRQLQAGPPPSTAGVPTVRTGVPALAGLSPEARHALAALAWTRRHGGAPASAGLLVDRQSVQGAGASAGVYTGTARVIRSESEFVRVQPGDVLVCPFTSPTWTVLFSTVGAVVTDEGGLLSHPAITAREFAIPAVVGTRVATDVIPDGSVVRVDGAAGLVLLGEPFSVGEMEPRARAQTPVANASGRSPSSVAADAPALVWLNEKACQNPPLTGGKAANLSQLADRYRVPDGFCVTTAAYETAGVGGGVLSARLRDQVAAAYAELSHRAGHDSLAVAVRSSATDEDGQNAAFAGQYETMLNVRGADALEEAIVQCWRSGNSARARAYREARGRSAEDVRIAVLVQQMVPAEAAGVIFSANPVTGDKHRALVTAALGLGESVVRGSVTPDTFVLEREGPFGPVILDRQIATKNVMTVLTDTGTVEAAVPEAWRDDPSVSDQQVREAAALAWQLESEMGWPVDVECAWHNGVLYVLQCRPITALTAQR